ncbi:MAG: protein kinase [Labilithrix sp.]|nr:protein kinase [Labilithrix sp.]MBX3215798.1 protein kinase [Labilithrix sp.]
MAPPSTTGDYDAAEIIADRYEILGLVGSGGMGTVYRARDRELDEVVALKILRGELSYDPQALARFRREVKLARRVTHRNVARTFDIGAHQGTAFLTMELVHGESLAQLLARKKQLSLERAVEIALEIARGLAAAHEAGVVHRDLKPDNVLVAREGRIVVTDFGIAFAEEAIAAEGGARRIVGTPAYMAPEQLETPEKIDARVDVYALGLVLYEMLTGELPWVGKTDLALATARLLRPPRDPRELVPGLPPSIVAVLFAALTRDAGDRLASAELLATKLGGIAMPTSPTLLDESGSFASLLPPPPVQRSVAVLRLRHVGVADDDYLSTGIAEALVDALASAGVRVRAAPADVRERDPQEAGRQLGVDAVLSGAVEVGAADVRVALRLVGANDGFALWAGRFDGARGDAIAIAGSAARGVVHALSGGITPTPVGDTAGPEAVDLYLRGRRAYHRFWRTNEAVTLLERAIAKAPDDPRFLAALALALSRETGAETDTASAREAAVARAERAVALAPSLAEAHVALGVARLRDGNVGAASELLRRGLELAPGSVDALEHAGRVLLDTHAMEEGIAHAELAMRVEPLLRLVLQYQVVRARALLGEWDAVDAELRRRPSEDAAKVAYWLTRTRLALWRNDDGESASVLEGLAADAFPNKAFPLAYAAYLKDGRPGPVERQLLEDRMLAPRSSPRQRAFFAQLRAELLLRTGDRDDAIAAIEAAVRDGLFDEAWLDRCPALDAVRDDDRFARAAEVVHARASIVVATLLRRDDRR